MAANPLLAASFVIYVCRVLFVVCAVALILVVLIQKGRGGGLGGLFGGGAAGGLLGSKTGDFLTWVTIVLVGLFLVLAVVETKFDKPALSGAGEGPGRRPPARTEQRQPTAPQLRESGVVGRPVPANDMGSTTGEVDESTDANLLGMR